MQKRNINLKFKNNLNKSLESLDILNGDNLHREAGYSPLDEALILKANNSLISSNPNNLIGIQTNGGHTKTSASITCQPTTEDQKAGLLAYCGESEWYYLHISGNSRDTIINVAYHKKGELGKQKISPIIIAKQNPVQLKIDIEAEKILFYYSVEKYRWYKVGPSLSIENKNNAPFIGFYCEALDKNFEAKFHWIKFKEKGAKKRGL